jgi:hypothetical protein
LITPPRKPAPDAEGDGPHRYLRSEIQHLVETQTKLIAACELARRTLIAFAEEDGIENPEEIIAVRQIDAALASAQIQENQ